MAVCNCVCHSIPHFVICNLCRCGFGAPFTANGFKADKLSIEDRIEKAKDNLWRNHSKNQQFMMEESNIKAQKKMFDNVNHPSHYNSSEAKCECGRRIECIDVSRNFSFNLGNAIKYLWRCEYKGSTVEDLKKAVWYIEDEINKWLKKPIK